MSSISLPDYQHLWTDAITRVLDQVGAQDWHVDMFPLLGSAESLGNEVWVNFSVSKRLTGLHAFRIKPEGAKALGAILLGRPATPDTEFDDEEKDALGELFRQFAGAVAVALKMRLGDDVLIQFTGHDNPSWRVGMRQGISLVPPGGGKIELHFLADRALIESLIKSVTAPSPAAEAASHAPEAPIPSAGGNGSASLPRNLELLLDVELDVTLRFGGREMLLRDVLELNPGSVLELDRQITDPVELMVSDKVIAWGEVVIVDGNYGLRINRLLSPTQRMAAIPKGAL